MRLQPQQIALIKQLTRDIFGAQAMVCWFGSRLDAAGLGGDVDLHIDCSERVESSALAMSRLGAACSRAMFGRKVDVVLSAPGFSELPIHCVAKAEGIVL